MTLRPLISWNRKKNHFWFFFLLRSKDSTQCASKNALRRFLLNSQIPTYSFFLSFFLSKKNRLFDTTLSFSIFHLVVYVFSLLGHEMIFSLFPCMFRSYAAFRFFDFALKCLNLSSNNTERLKISSFRSQIWMALVATKSSWNNRLDLRLPGGF